MEINAETVVCASKDVVVCELDSGAALLDLKSGSYFNLNGTTNFIWANIAEPTKVASLTEKLLEQYDVKAEIIENDLIKILNDLSNFGLVEVSQQAV
ncbi:PqqD family protein [Pseudaquidulcibacter saccharophilus]|uniref:PqqD family protein n=1 Tax=Pseudaquidulcibacter saccharophilus TaxID=2831900 RepID=UPI001EFF1B93|nr:PqqD family protein [Pseudaquidulcibacter saccharophilus]